MSGLGAPAPPVWLVPTPNGLAAGLPLNGLGVGADEASGTPPNGNGAMAKGEDPACATGLRSLLLGLDRRTPSQARNDVLVLGAALDPNDLPLDDLERAREQGASDARVLARVAHLLDFPGSTVHL